MRNVTFGLNSGRTTLSGRPLRWPRWYLDGWWSKLLNWPWILPQPPGIDADELKVLVSFFLFFFCGGEGWNEPSIDQVYHSLYSAMFIIVLVTWLSLLVSLSYSISNLVLKLWCGDPAGITSISDNFSHCLCWYSKINLSLKLLTIYCEFCKRFYRDSSADVDKYFPYWKVQPVFS